MAYRVLLRPSVRRALTHGLPAAVAAAVTELLGGPLADNPRRVGRPLRGAMYGLHAARRGEYRVIYVIDEDVQEVRVIRVEHRGTVYRR